MSIFNESKNNFGKNLFKNAKIKNKSKFQF